MFIRPRATAQNCALPLVAALSVPVITKGIVILAEYLGANQSAAHWMNDVLTGVIAGAAILVSLRSVERRRAAALKRVQAIALAWPTDGRLVIKSLASGSPNYSGEIARIGLLGSKSNLVWSRNADGVTINLPEKPPCDYAYVFKINPLRA